jgi:GNAT superfamily N-acetyltransferase
VSVSVRDARTSEADRLWIERVYRDYLDDLAPLNTGIFPILGEVGHREPDQIARWFGDPNAFPLVIAKSSEPVPVGFAMVVRVPSSEGTAAPRTSASVSGSSGSSGTGPRSRYRMAEFFVSRPNRGLGVGRGAVQLILDRFAGRWEIVEYLRNPGAVRFWRRVVSVYTRGHYQERVINGEVHQVFESGRAAR